MKPSLLITIVILMLVGRGAKAQDYFKAGDTLYVWSNTSLNVRSQTTGAVADQLPYGTQVIVLEGQQPAAPKQEVIAGQLIGKEQFPAFHLVGNYIPIRYGNKSGFVFGGYLSKLPPRKTQRLNGANESTKEYFERNFGVFKTTHSEKEGDHGKYKTDRVVYGNGVCLNYGGDGYGGSEILILPDLSLVQGYLFLNQMHNFDAAKKNGRDLYVNSYNQQTQTIDISMDFEFFQLHKIGPYLIVTSGWSE
ncbi:hypothetical protein [Chryseolinea lacunae]|uniref:SH3b domain-containing protein n=1 Tax=Chryseolinea lacunae TaxID=2801331 RepID=A0ABS1KTP1_9BACT|nr:hypothetical protein [Chryseolinea lacunae]MBL0742637.1 hypothetical protein [Chryseolinea lacunae]